MNVSELIEMLSQFDKNMPVVIGMKQKFGCDFAKEISHVSIERINGFFSGDADVVVITQAEQIGVVDYGYLKELYEEDEEVTE